jgi:hypothetical protein
MRYYLIDEITSREIEQISGFLRDNATASGLDNVFWVNIPDGCLNVTQQDHADCRPYCFAVELGRNLIKAELFVRTLRGFNCACSGFSNEAQARFIVNFVDGIIRELKIKA